MEKNILKWELFGAAFIIILGSLMHSMFIWLNYWLPSAIFLPVNESVWEHLKLGFWPLLIFSIIEYKFINHKSNNFLVAKTIAAYIIPLVIVIIFYAYTAILGEHLLIMDILSFIIAVIIGQLVSYKLLTKSEFPKGLKIFASILFAFLGFLFIIFTFFQPPLQIFMDATTGEYGIPNL